MAPTKPSSNATPCAIPETEFCCGGMACPTEMLCCPGIGHVFGDGCCFGISSKSRSCADEYLSQCPV